MPTRLCLHNTMADRMEIFKPRRRGKVKLFTCGPSIYNWPHIGNYRTFLYEDVLQRYLEYLGYRVERLINFTDVEDKAIAEAREKGITLEALTEPVAKSFRQDCRALRIQLPEIIPRSSTSVDQAVVLIRKLLDRGYAYWHGRDVFYDPLKFKGFGKLYGLDMSRWPRKKIRFRKDTYPGQRWNLGDFILWHGRRGSQDKIYWDTDIGQGRPSWNIQDPAMITKHLGHQVDISCGGVDNLYRHHDYNIAVIEAVSGKPFAGYWLHGEHVLVRKVKMSKSRGNITYLSDLTARGYQPHHLRFYLIYGHYREKLNLNVDHLHLARGKVDSFRDLASRLAAAEPDPAKSDPAAEEHIESLRREFEDHMNDDLDLRGAFDAVYAATAALASIQARNGLSGSDARRAFESLRQIDTVWQVTDA